MKRIEVFKETQDDWYPSYYLKQGNMLVSIMYHGNISHPGIAAVYRTSVWGNDDCGMEYDSTNEAECWNVFLQVIGMNYVNRADLYALGFLSA